MQLKAPCARYSLLSIKMWTKFFKVLLLFNLMAFSYSFLNDLKFSFNLFTKKESSNSMISFKAWVFIYFNSITSSSFVVKRICSNPILNFFIQGYILNSIFSFVLFRSFSWYISFKSSFDNK